MRPTLLIMTGTSAAGKTEQLRLLEEVYGKGRVLTIAARARRPNESVDAYHFVTDRELNQLEADGKTLWVVGAYGKRYSINKDDIWSALINNDGFGFVVITPDCHAFLAKWCHDRDIRPINVHFVAPDEPEQRSRLQKRDGSVDEARVSQTPWFEAEATKAAEVVELHFISQGNRNEVLKQLCDLVDT